MELPPPSGSGFLWEAYEFRTVSQRKKFAVLVMLHTHAPFIFVPLWANYERSDWFFLGIPAALFGLFLGARAGARGATATNCEFLPFLLLALFFVDGFRSLGFFLVLCAIWSRTIYLIAEDTLFRWAYHTFMVGYTPDGTCRPKHRLKKTSTANVGSLLTSSSHHEAMISFEEAKQIALAKIGPDNVLIETAPIEKPHGWYFNDQSRAYVETGDFWMKLYGSSGFIVASSDGRVLNLGSGYPARQWITAYERGLTYSSYDLRIDEVIDMRETVELLAQLQMWYLIAEQENRPIRERYTPIQLWTALGRLPCIFSDQGFAPWVVDVFDEINASGCCKYELGEHVGESGPGRSSG